MSTTTTGAGGETPIVPDLQGEMPKTPPVTGETPEAKPTSIEDALKELESLKKALAKANNEAATHRHKAKELDDLKAAAEADKLSETERLQKQVADLQAKHDAAIEAAQARTVGYEVRLQAAALGMNTTAATRLLDMSEVEYGEDGSPTNIEALLKALLKEMPFLAGRSAAPSSGGATNPSRSQSSATGGLTWEILGKMPRDEYNARRPEIMAWISNNPIK